MPNLRQAMMGAAGAGGADADQIYSWGGNWAGMVGDGTVVNPVTSPVQVGSGSESWVGVSGGNIYTSAIRDDGTLWMWGGNSAGVLGQGDVISRSSPVQVGSLTDWSKLCAGGDENMVAIKTDGTLWLWGANSAGQLGTGDEDKRSSPIQLGSLTNWKQASFGLRSMGFVKTDGTLWTIGNGGAGQNGDSRSSSDIDSPVQVGTSTNWAYISCPREGRTGVRTDGTLWAWGSGEYGITGLDTALSISSQTQVGSLTDWAQVGEPAFNGNIHIKIDGTLWAWGQQNAGLGNGDGTAINRSSPVQIGTDTDWFAAGYGNRTGTALRTDGTLWAWGAAGYVGDSTAIGRSSPVQIGTDTDWRVEDGTTARPALSVTRWVPR